MSRRARVRLAVFRLAARWVRNPTVAQLRRLQGPPLKKAKQVVGVTTRDVVMGGIDLEVLEPDGEWRGDLMFFHGGAYVAGTRRSVRTILGPICREAGLRGWSPEYRLAPEHPAPAALADAVEAWTAVVASGVDPARLLLGGESAGGGLALALAVTLRDRGLPLPAGLLLLWPWTDLTLGGASSSENVRRDVLPAALLALGVSAYSADATDPLVSPLWADLSGLPPVFVQVGEHDLVRDDSTRLAERLEAAGVEHVLHVWPRMPHAWVGVLAGLPEARRAVAQSSLWASAVLPTPPAP